MYSGNSHWEETHAYGCHDLYRNTFLSIGFCGYRLHALCPGPYFLISAYRIAFVRALYARAKIAA